MSITLIERRCQLVPDRERGVVFGLDISKDSISYRAHRPEAVSRAFTVSQDMGGFRKIEGALEEFKARGHDVWVGYEPTGPYSCCILEYLAENGWRVVQVNPKHTSRYNDIMDNVPGKSDPRDPRGIAGLIWQGCYRIPVQLTGTYAELRAASRDWSMLANEHTRLRNQLHSLVELWCPELRQVFKDVLCKSGRALICRYESGEALVKAGVEKVRRVLARASQGTTAYRAADVVKALGDSKALKSGQNARRRSILDLIARLNLVESQQQRVRADMQSLLSELPESALLMSVKGMGVVTCAMVLGECGNLGDYRLDQLEKLVGLNLCEFSSGTHKGRRKISKCGRSAVRYAVCVAATRMANKYGIYHDVAQEMRSRGMSFGQIRVAVARKLLRLLHALAVQHNSFDPLRFVARRKTADDLSVHQDRPRLVAA